ncbi:MAG: MerR family transcriptional regulator [Oscillospiraceae bacterium]|nr:MerR family transcriptional regulator [Oscillospiraceae bacterium]
MEKHRAIPDGYMKVGELAKKMGVTVRTLQYYDKEGLLSPSTESEGGFRLYTDKDMVKLIQIVTMKQLGFSLNGIKQRLVSLDTPADMVHVLTEHEASIREKIETLSESLQAIGALKAEVIQMKTMDFKKYADILICLQMKDENYWVIKHMDEDVMEHFRNYFDEDSASAFLEKLGRLGAEAAQLHREGVSPESEKGQIFAKVVWETIQVATNGDATLISKFAESLEKIESLAEEQRETVTTSHDFIRAALDAYFGRKV